MNKKTLVGTVGAGAAALLLYWVPTFEGMVLRGYQDPIGVITACAGHTKTAVLGKPYTRAECEKLLDEDLVEHAQGALSCVQAPLTVGQRAAVVSFAYNVGVTAFCQSTFARKLNAKDPSACDELSRWIRAGGRVLLGLVERRKVERDICKGNIG